MASDKTRQKEENTQDTTSLKQKQKHIADMAC